MPQPNQQRVLAPGGGNTYVDPNAWVTPQSSWSQTDWYIDPVNGKDTNSGADAAHPVQTVMGGIVSKWGTPSPTLAQTTTFHLLGTQTAGQEDIVLAPTLVGANNFIILGTLTAVGAAFSPAAVTAKAPGSPGVLLQISVPAGTTPGMLIHNTTKDSWAFVDSVSAGVATMAQPFATAGLTSVNAGPTLVEDNTWATGDSYQRYSLPTLNLKVLSPQGGDTTTSFSTPCAWVQNVYIPDPAGTPSCSQLTPVPVGCGCVFSNCWIDQYLTLTSETVGASGCFILNCRLNGGGAFKGGGQLENVQMMGGILGSTAASLAVIQLHGHTALSGDTIVHTPAASGGNPTLAFFGPPNYVACYFDANVLAMARYGGVIVIQDVPGLGPGVGHPVLWGAGTLDTEGPNAAIKLETGDSWANSLKMGTLHLDGAATGNKFVPGAPGVFTNAIPLTTANLDTNSGLSNPLTGCRYSN